MSRKKKNRNVNFCVSYSRYSYTSIHRVISRLKISFNLSWLIVRMPYHIFNNLAELINRDLAAKIGRVIFSEYFMDRECNCSLRSKVNDKFFYEGKCRSKCIIYQVQLSMYDAIYIGNSQQTFKERMDGHFSDLLRILKNVQKSDLFAAHFEQHFNTTTSHTGLRKYMMFKLIEQINPIVTMKTFTKPNCNLCMEERLTIIKRLHEKRFIIMNKNS